MQAELCGARNTIADPKGTGAAIGLRALKSASGDERPVIRGSSVSVPVNKLRARAIERVGVAVDDHSKTAMRITRWLPCRQNE